MERLFQILTVILVGVAAFSLWQGYSDGVFACGVLGACSFFLSVRFRIKERIKQREAEEIAKLPLEEDNTETSQ